VLEDAEHLVVTRNARQEAHMPMLFSPTIGAAIAARHWLSARRPPSLSPQLRPARFPSGAY